VGERFALALNRIGKSEGLQGGILAPGIDPDPLEMKSDIYRDLGSRADAFATVFESGDRITIDGLEYGVQNGNYPWSISMPDADTFRFEVRSGDRWQYDPDWKERSEISGDTGYDPGQTLTVTYDFMVEPGDPNTMSGGAITGKWLTLGQFHATDGVSSSVFCVELIGEKMAIRAAYETPGDGDSWYVYTDTQNITRGKYYDMKITVNFENNDDGFLYVWRDGEQIVDYEGPMGYGYGVYWKNGIYRHEANETVAVNFRDLKITDGDPVVADGEGVTVVGTPNSDVIRRSKTPAGEPALTNNGDEIYGKGGRDQVKGGKGGDLISADGGNDQLNGGKGGDEINGGWDNDTMTGGAGNDVFAFASDFGDDVIRDFRPGQDKIAFDDAVFSSFESVMSAAEKSRGGVLISSGHDSIFLKKVDIDSLHADDFLFT
jgi:Ca2+-binding RTX toxin-like protein